MRRVVDQAGFDKIKCGRCGQCCERIVMDGGISPLKLLEMYGEAEAEGIQHHAFFPLDFMEFSGQLVPRWDEELDCWVYTCGHFSRDEDGTGVCGIYEQRPNMCSTIPNGNHETRYDKCDWNGELVEYEVVQ